MVIVLATAIALGTFPVPGATEYEWELAYSTGSLHLLVTSVPRLDFEPLPGRPFTVRVRADGGQWSEASYEMIVNPLEADADFDCDVDNRDFDLLRGNFGGQCP